MTCILSLLYIFNNWLYSCSKLDVSLCGDQFILKEYAYNSPPGAPINAGQTTLSLEDNQLSTIKIVALNKRFVEKFSYYYIFF